MTSRSGGAARAVFKVAACFVAALLIGANLGVVAATLRATPAAADTAPTDPSLETVSAARLPTVQINGVVWDTLIVGNRVFATGQFSQARPAGAAAGVNETPRSNILAFDLTSGNLITSWAPTLNAQGGNHGVGRRFDDLRRRRLRPGQRAGPAPHRRDRCADGRVAVLESRSRTRVSTPSP